MTATRWPGGVAAFETFVNAADQGVNSISPADTDIGPKLQVTVDANPGRTIVIPPFHGSVLNCRTEIILDGIGTTIENHAVIESPFGTYAQQGIFAIRKRVAGGAKLHSVSVRFRGQGRTYFHPADYKQFAPVAGSTVFPWVTAATSRNDFAVYRTRAGVSKLLSPASDLSVGDGTGFTLASASVAGDVYDGYVVTAHQRRAGVYVEGTAVDRIGLVKLDDIHTDGFGYIGIPLMYYDEVWFNRVTTYGCINRGGVYPYLSGGLLRGTDLTVRGKMRNGPALLSAMNGGQGVSSCFYGLDPLPAGGQSIEEVRLSGVNIQDTAAYAFGMGSGDIKRMIISGLQTKNAGVYHILGLNGASPETEGRDVLIEGIQAEGPTVAEPLYWLGGNATLEGTFRGTTGSVRIGGTGSYKVAMRAKLDIINPTVTQAFLAQQQTSPDFDIKVYGGPAGNVSSIDLFDLTGLTGQLKAARTTNAGEGVLLSGVTGGRFGVHVAGTSRGCLLYNNATKNRIDINVGGVVTTGIETTAGSNYNSFDGVARGPTFPFADPATGNKTNDLIV
jgi:hypothetical protein